MLRHGLVVIGLVGIMGTLLVAGLGHQAGGQGAPSPLPEGPGLAAKYPGDARLADDPAVALVEDFEAASLAEVTGRWEQVQGTMALADDVPAGSAGKHSLQMTHVGGQGSGCTLYRRLPRSYDRLFYRFYVKFDPDCWPIHHFFHVGGYNPPTAWAQGGAGERPGGDERITVGVEPFGQSWIWNYYAYWMEMRGSPPRGQTWGNCFTAESQPKAERGQWTCLELMIKLNQPVTERNGEIALWKDGKLVTHLGPGYPRGKWTFDRFLVGQGGEGIRWNDQKGDRETFDVAAAGEPFEGFRWRGSEDLKLNFLWVLFCITKAPEGHASQVWFDDIVAATEYIGPLAPAEVPGQGG
ncbi:MAG TPA: hypothetical protein QGH10_26585 [Armatimonadota bacterium]|nr:hypothetical protein [Candidatus Brocadiia bacterium]HJN19094.1 hypothetical protein [Armatimonadota bacterium]